MYENSYCTRVKIKNILIKKLNKLNIIDNLSMLKEEMMNLPKPDYANNFVFGEGVQNPKYMFIGEAPGEEEDKQKRPFVGKSGILLRNIIKYMNGTFYMTNTIPYRPPNNRNPTREEIELYRPYLLKHIKFVNPLNIILVGKVAIYALLKLDEPMSKLRQKQYKIMDIKTFVFYHTSYLIRFPSQKKEAYIDMQYIMQYSKNI